MEDTEALAATASLEDVKEAEPEEQPGQQPEAPETPETEAEKKAQANRERRDREKAYKARLREEAADAQRKVEEAEARKAKIVEAGQRKAQPTESEFADYTEFQMAKALWKAKQEEREEAASEAGSEAEEARKRAATIKAQEDRIIAAQWTEQVNEAKAKYADFEAVALNPEVPVSDAMAELIRTSESGADVAYHLGRNKAVAAQIAAMPPLEAARAIGRIEATLTAPKARTATNAPDPISPTRATAGAPRNPEKMTAEEWRKFRMGGGTL